jgi:hypothetical protein
MNFADSATAPTEEGALSVIPSIISVGQSVLRFLPFGIANPLAPLASSALAVIGLSEGVACEAVLYLLNLRIIFLLSGQRHWELFPFSK